MNTQPQDPQKIRPVEGDSENTPAASAESIPTSPTPENLTPPVVEVSAQTEIDHLSAVSAPIPTQVDPAVNDSPADGDKVTEPLVEPNDVGDLDKKYFKAADEATEALAEKPYEEEERAEDLSVGYLHDRFGKEIQKSEE